MTKNEIVVAIDESPAGQAALRWAAGHAELTGATLRAVHVYDPPLQAFARPYVLEKGVYSTDDAVPPALRSDVTAVFNEIKPHAHWTLEFVPGETGRVLVEESGHSLLLVVGTHEHVGLGRVLSGSTSHHCLSHALCPVVAVPPPKVANQDRDAHAPAVSA